MKRKLTAASLTALLAVGALAGTGFSAAPSNNTTPASNASVGKTYMVAFQKELPANYDSIIADAGGKVLRALPELGGLEVASSNPSFLDNLKGVAEIQAANVEMVHRLDYKKNDPTAADGQPVTDIPQPDQIDSYWKYQWDIQRITNNGASYSLETGGAKNADGTVTHKAVVGIIDSGIDPNHPDLKGNLLGGANFVPAGVDDTEKGDPNDILDRDGHGTHVAGSIAGNGKVKGVGPELGIRVYRVFPKDAGAPTAWIVDAIVQAANDRVDVINMSLGGFDSHKYFYQGNKYSDVADILLWKRAIQYAIQHNVTVVAAAGNDSLNLDDKKAVTAYMNATYGYLGLQFKGPTTEVPGQIPGVITVSSSIEWSTDKIAFYSNYGKSTITVAGPGGDNGPVFDATRDLMKRDFHYRTLSTWPTYLPSYFTSNLKSYALLHGTSMASPKVAGIAGVIKAAHPELTPPQVAALISQTANDYGKPGKDELFGAGEANAYNALTGTKK
ncbi:S8 family serine peptidase [Effusibacillus pohliae]|uniref:S8 family serine peptidase n=1 Tax=Effusibacillus pohliae TaxID=232270 RepID=UPI000365AF17|nr:S8 family serine peptidase [Effusibacillus pohliae]